MASTTTTTLRNTPLYKACPASLRPYLEQDARYFVDGQPHAKAKLVQGHGMPIQEYLDCVKAYVSHPSVADAPYAQYLAETWRLVDGELTLAKPQDGQHDDAVAAFRVPTRWPSPTPPATTTPPTPPRSRRPRPLGCPPATRTCGTWPRAAVWTRRATPTPSA